MRKYVLLITVLALIGVGTILVSEPSFNGNNPGCAGGGCHSFHAGDLSVNTNELQVEVTLANVPAGNKIGGELVDSQGNVVSVINSTTSNPFILTAPSAGTYLVNAGYKKPSRNWDSTMVQITLSSIDQVHSSLLPQTLTLYDNHPNPFNNETLIRFSLSEQEFISLRIFNMNGQLVRDLVSNNLPAGLHNVRWNGKDNSGYIVASGVYLYTLQGRAQTISKRLMLIK